ncbi:MAG TPA: DegT/DnrJ/EryC1/StrS family aminotransferase [Thermoanaerobaculia bacterium]
MSGVPYLDLARAAEGDEPELSAAVLAAVRRGRYVLGSEVAAFEFEWAAFCGAARAVGVANGTDAITLALRALGIGPGDEVLTVSMTCAPTATGVLRAGATPVFVDVDEERLTMDARALDAAVTPRTKAILPVHLYGRLADVDALSAFTSARGLVFVEDCAQAHGAAWNGRPAGTFGRAAAWSFYPTKNLGALGDGGAVTVAGEGDAAVADRVARLRAYGYVTRNDAGEPGYNSRLDEVQAAALRVRLRKLGAGNRRRAAIAARYDSALAGAVRVPPPAREGETPAHHLYVVRVPDRDAFRARLAERGIGTDVHYPRAVHEQPAFASLPRGPLPVTERAMREVVSLPLDPMLTDAEADQVIEAVLASAR